jgi:hypothetical protein
MATAFGMSAELLMSAPLDKSGQSFRASATLCCSLSSSSDSGLSIMRTRVSSDSPEA